MCRGLGVWVCESRLPSHGRKGSHPSLTTAQRCSGMLLALVEEYHCTHPCCLHRLLSLHICPFAHALSSAVQCHSSTSDCGRCLRKHFWGKNIWINYLPNFQLSARQTYASQPFSLTLSDKLSTMGIYTFSSFNILWWQGLCFNSILCEDNTSFFVF